MMKTRRVILILTIFVCMFVLFCFETSANTSYITSRISDKDGYISEENKEKLEEKLREAEKNSGVDFRVYVYEYSAREGYVDMYDYERAVGENFENLVLLVVSYEYGEYYYELFTKGSADTDISDKEVNKILDNDDVYDNLKSGKLYDGIDAYISLAERAVVGKLRNSFKSVFVPSLVISIIAAIVVGACVLVKYRKKLHSQSYPLEKYARLDLTVANDNFITKTVTRVRVNSSSGSSSKGGGRSFSGGGSRGRR